MKKALVGLFLLLVSAPPITAETLVLATMDIRRSPTSAPFLHRTNPVSDHIKKVTFTLYTGDLWLQNPEAHAYLLGDGYIAPGQAVGSLRGRGITIGHTRNCKGVGFEKFGFNNGYAEGCIEVVFQPNSFYHFKMWVDPEAVEVNITGSGVNESSMLSFSGEYLSKDTIMGVAGDRKSSTYGVFNVIQTLGHAE